MERHGHRPAEHTARGAVRVLSRTILACVRSSLAAALVLLVMTDAAGQDLAPPLAARFNDAVAALQAGQLDAAERGFRAVIGEGGDRAFVRHNLGIVLQQRGRHTEAAAEFRLAVRQDPAFGPAHLLLGTSLLELGQPRTAKSTLQRAVALLPAEPAARLQLADACERTGDTECIVAQYRILAQRSPENAEYAYRLGKAYLRVAQSAHERIRRIDPRAARLSQALGREYLRQGQADLAMRAFEEAAARDPALPDIHLALARIHFIAGRLDDASREVARELVLAPENHEARALAAALEGKK